MFGVFRATNVSLGGLLWKIPWRMSRHQKARQRKRLAHVDSVIETLYKSLQANNFESRKVTQLYKELPKASEMKPKDKYTVFDKKAVGYRKGAHKVPKWTKITIRNNPEHF